MVKLGSLKDKFNYYTTFYTIIHESPYPHACMFLISMDDIISCHLEKG